MPTDAEYIQEIEAAWQEGLDLANSSDGWKKEKQDKNSGDLVEMKKLSDGRKIYRGQTKINMPKKLLEEYLLDTDNVKGWNTTLEESRTLKNISDNVRITYQVTASAGGGIVASRDFVYGSKVGTSGANGEIFVIGGKSIDFADAPKDPKIVRAINGPGCHIVKSVEGEENQCILIWLLNCDFKGMMPGYIADLSMPMAQTQFMECLRKLADKLKEEGKF